MFASVHFNGRAATVDRPRYLRRHDIVYLVPDTDSCNGFPLGDGDRTCLCHTKEDGLTFTLRKSDAVDYGPDGNFKAWAWESEEKNTAQVSCGTLTLSDGMPSLDWAYLQRFTQRLNLADGLWEHASQTPFSTWKLQSFFSLTDNVLVLRGHMESDAPAKRTLTLERFGSRNFYHWYEQIAPCADKGLSRIVTGERGGCFYVGQELRGGAFVTCAAVVQGQATVTYPHARGVQAVFAPSENLDFTLLLTIEAGDACGELIERGCARLSKAAQDLDTLQPRHEAAWHDFWRQSFIHLPDYDYLENIYYTHLYLLRCASMGRVPVSFTGPFAAKGDLRNWGHVYHWNAQQTYWPLLACGHRELMDNMLDFRFGMLNNARADAQALHGARGAFFSDIANLNGYQALEPDTVRNFTCGAQIALAFYNVYRYSLDLSFLREKAYPMLKAAGDLYVSVLDKQDGVYHIRGGAVPYESYLCLRDTVTDWAHIRALFSALIAVSPLVDDGDADMALWEDILQNLFPLPLTEKDGTAIFAAGTDWDGSPFAHNAGQYPLSPFPACQMAPVFPAGVIGLHDAGNPLFPIAVATAQTLIGEHMNKTPGSDSSGHSPLPQSAARLGLGRETWVLLRQYVETYQIFRNGMTHFADIAANQQWGKTFRPRVLDADAACTGWEQVHEKATGTRVELPSGAFLHGYLESGSNIVCGVQEALLQSCGDIIRVFPAVPDAMSALFTLHAAGGFTVTSEINKGDIRFVHIVSRAGQDCRVFAPWDEPTTLYDGDNAAIAHTRAGRVLAFPTQKGQHYTLTRKSRPLDCYYTEEIPCVINQKPKRWGRARLGQSNGSDV